VKKPVTKLSPIKEAHCSDMDVRKGTKREFKKSVTSFLHDK